MDANLLKKIVVAAILIGSIISIFILSKGPLINFISQGFETFRIWLSANKLLGSLCFVFVQGAAAIFLLPVTAFGLLAGSLFQPLIIAVLLTLTGNQIGIIGTYFLGRTFLRPWVQSRLLNHPRMKAIDSALEQDGFKLCILLRLTPIFPFGICNWIMATSNLPIWRICLGSLIGNIPNTIIHCLVGSLAGPSGDMPPKLKNLSILLTICFALGTSVFITLTAKKALRSVVDLEVDDDFLEEGFAAVPNDAAESAADEDSDAMMLPTHNAASESKTDFTDQEKRLLIATFAIIIVALMIGIPAILLL